MRASGTQLLLSQARRRRILVVGVCLVVGNALAALAVVVTELREGRAIPYHALLLTAILCLTLGALILLAYAWRRVRADQRLVDQVRSSEARLGLLASRAPASVWTTDTAFTPRALALKVREVLDQRPVPGPAS